MRVLISALGVLLVLACVAWLFKQQTQALKPAQVVPVAVEPGTADAGAPASPIPQVRQDLAKALAQDAARAASGLTP